MESLRYVTAASTTSLTIPARAGLNTRIIEVWIDSPAERSFMDVFVGPRQVLRVPVKWNDNLFIAPYTGSVNNISIFGTIRKIFGEDVYVEGDQSEDITLRFSGTMGRVHVLYQLHTEAVDKARPLRSLQARIPLFMALTHSSAVNTTKNYALDTALAPTGFPALKSGDTIPAGTRFTLKAVAFGSTKSGSSKPTALHLWRKEFEILSPESHTGITVDPDANFLLWDVRTQDFFTVPEYTYGPGDLLTATFDATYDGTNAIAAQTLALFLIGWFEQVR